MPYRSPDRRKYCPWSPPLIFCGVFLVSAAAHACSRPAQPHFPDPKTAEPAVVEKLDQDMQKYASGMNDYVKCLSREASEAQAEGTRTINAYNTEFLAAYNKRASAAQ